jgi:antitoxin component YwqK of YwqJK toxin-antitoxin module
MMENINKIDELGRRQGLWIINWSNDNVYYKTIFLNNEFMGHFQTFYSNGKLEFDLFYHYIF